MWEGHWMFGGFMWLFWIVVPVTLFFLFKWIISQKPAYQKPEENALEVLKKRYAEAKSKRMNSS